MITLTIRKQIISLSRHEQGLATAAHARSAMAPKFRDAIARCTTESTCSLTIAETTLERMVVKYSEQLVFQPLQEIQYWFTYNSGAFLEPGYAPLYYSREKNRQVSANKSATAAIGEGIAGFLAQRLYRCIKLARPNHDYPDIVMEDDNKTFLVEAKATLNPDKERLDAVVGRELPRLASLTSSAKQLDVRPVRGLLVGTALLSEVDYQCHLAELKLA